MTAKARILRTKQTGFSFELGFFFFGVFIKALLKAKCNFNDNSKNRFTRTFSFIKQLFGCVNQTSLRCQMQPIKL